MHCDVPGHHLVLGEASPGLPVVHVHTELVIWGELGHYLLDRVPLFSLEVNVEPEARVDLQQADLQPLYKMVAGHWGCM